MPPGLRDLASWSPPSGTFPARARGLLKRGPAHMGDADLYDCGLRPLE
jgi:hypothetical protein